MLLNHPEEVGNSWQQIVGYFFIPNSVTRVGLRARDGWSGISHFDNIIFGKAAPDIGVAMSVDTVVLNPLQNFTIDLTFNSGFNGLQPGLRIFHDGRISLVSHVCDVGFFSAISQGNDHYLQWTGIPEDVEPYTYTCSIVAQANTGFAGPFDLHAVAACEDCSADLYPANNEQTVPMHIVEAPDVAATVSVSDFPEAGGEVEVTLALENMGVTSGSVVTNVSVVLDAFLPFKSADGSACFLSESKPGTVEGPVAVDSLNVTECVLTLSIPEDQMQTALGVQLFTVTPADYRPDNDSDSDDTRIVNLMVNRVNDGWDRDSGDGICEQTQDSDDCSLRAAVMEANALAAETGRVFTVKIPASPFAYTLTRTSGDDSSLYGSLKIKRRMQLVGIPDQAGNWPIVFGSFPSADADRLIRIGDPASFVRIENLHLRCQNLVPTDTDGFGSDGGLILHRSGALNLVNVTLADGATDGRGGAIYSASDDTNGDLGLEGVKIFDNLAALGGGVAFVPETGLTTLSLEQTEIYGNQAETGGGILAADLHPGALPVVSINRSSLYENHALSDGGAVWLHDVTLASLDNSTISGNVAENAGGGIGVAEQTPLAINNSTVAFNEAHPGDNSEGLGGGLYLTGYATITLYNSIVSSNSAKVVCSTPNPPLPPLCFPQAANCYGIVDSAGYNAMAGDSECGLNSEPGDVGSQVQLEPLADNGGPTLTHAPASFTWIVDAGDPACLERPGGDVLTIDQRGALRPFDGDETGGAQCDRGAYELSDSARVTVMVDDSALGRVQSSPSGIWCGAGAGDSCSALFGFKVEVTLTATVNSGS